MKKFIVGFLVFAVAAVAVAVIARNIILKTAVEQIVTRVTGFKTQVKSITHEFPATIWVQNLKIENPAGFQERTFANIPEIYVNLDVNAFLKEKKIHIPEIRLNIQEVRIEKNDQGVTNVEKLASVAPAAPAGEQKPAEPAKPAEMMPFLIDRFELTMREVSFSDPNGVVPSPAGIIPQGLPTGFIPSKVIPKDIIPEGVTPKRVAVDMNIDKEVFTNVDKPDQIVRIILLKIISGTTFGNLMKLNPAQLLDGQLQNSLAAGQALLGQGKEALAGAVNDFSAQAENLVGGQAEALKEKMSQTVGGLVPENILGEGQNKLGGAADATKQQISGLFGKLKSAAQEVTSDSGTAAQAQ